MPKRKRIKLLIEVDLDPVPGTFHTPESWLDHFGSEWIIPPWYNPDVQALPTELNDQLTDEFLSSLNINQWRALIKGASEMNSLKGTSNVQA